MKKLNKIENIINDKLDLNIFIKNRTPKYVEARWLFVYFAIRYTSYSDQEIADYSDMSRSNLALIRLRKHHETPTFLYKKELIELDPIIESEIKALPPIPEELIHKTINELQETVMYQKREIQRLQSLLSKKNIYY